MKGITITELREALIEAQERMFLICNEHSNKDQYSQGRDHGILSALTEILGFIYGEREDIIGGLVHDKKSYIEKEGGLGHDTGE